MEFEQLLRRRRMVRHFSDEALPRAAVERIAEAAQRAPSAGFSQGQRLVVVTDPRTRRRVAEAIGEEHYEEAGFDPWVSVCGAQFVPCVSEQVYHQRYREPDKLAADGSEREWPVPYWWMDVGCTVMLILLAAVAEDLGAGFAGPGRGVDALREALSIPSDFTPVGVIPVGKRLPDRPSPSLRRGWVPRADFVRWEGWSGAGEL